MRFLTPTGWVVIVVAVLAASGWVKAWYWPEVRIERGPVETVTVSVPREVTKWRTRVETREIAVREAPAEDRESARAREGDGLLTAGTIPPAPHGGTAQAWLQPDGVTRLGWRPNPRPFLDLGGIREASAWAYVGDRYAVRYRQDLGRVGPAVFMVEAGAEMRRGEPGWFAGVGAGVRF